MLRFNKEQFYLKLPVSLQSLLCSAEGFRIKRERYGHEFGRLLREAEERSFFPILRIREYRDGLLRDMIQHCTDKIPFYQSRFREAGVAPKDVRTTEDLKNLPILSKDDVRKNILAITSSEVSPKDRVMVHTSGSTGSGLRFASTRLALQTQWAVWWRYRRWHGIELDTWCGYFGGRSVVPVEQKGPPFWRHNYPGRQIFFSGYHMKEDNLASYISELNRARPFWLHGYPSLLSLLAAFIIESGISLNYSVRWITVGAENLLPQQARLIEHAFGVRPIQHYGMAEAVANISECELGKLHVDEDFAAVEFLPNPDGVSCRLVGTNLTNSATPFIRYDIQDVVTLGDEECSCGRPGRIVASIDGRSEDYVILKDGTRLGRLDHVFKDLTNIREAQIYQEKPGQAIVKIVRAANYSESDERLLREELGKRWGQLCDVAIEYVKELPRSTSGKLRFVISDLNSGKIESQGTFRSCAS